MSDAEEAEVVRTEQIQENRVAGEGRRGCGSCLLGSVGAGVIVFAVLTGIVVIPLGFEAVKWQLRERGAGGGRRAGQ